MFIKIAAPSNTAKDAIRSPVGPNCGAYLLDDLRMRFRQNNKIIFLPETA
jgi:hypothetical protein